MVLHEYIRQDINPPCQNSTGYPEPLPSTCT